MGERGEGGDSSRCEKGSIVSASRFRPVIGSDSVLTLNARASPPALVATERDREGLRGAREEGRRGRVGFRDGRCRPILPSSYPPPPFPRPLVDNIRSCMILLRVSQWPSGQARSTSIYVPGAPNYRRPKSAVDNE